MQVLGPAIYGNFKQVSDPPSKGVSLILGPSGAMAGDEAAFWLTLILRSAVDNDYSDFSA